MKMFRGRYLFSKPLIYHYVNIKLIAELNIILTIGFCLGLMVYIYYYLFNFLFKIKTYIGYMTD
jgi:hypothetical protein